MFLILYRANREISKVCLPIIFVCGSETGFLACLLAMFLDNSSS